MSVLSFPENEYSEGREHIQRDHQTILPHSPHLRNFKLSLLDQLSPPVYVPFIFFYAPAKNSKLNTTGRIAQIKTSLSEILIRFYPVAGRLKDNSLIDCNNEGVDFLEAQASCSLQEILRQPEPNVLNNFLPQGYVNSTKSPTEFQLAAQVNTISCGGIAIGVCFLHKIFDGSMIGSFINGWAATTRGSGESVTPIFSGASRFPPRDLPGNILKAKCMTKRYVFDGSSIALFKRKSSHQVWFGPTNSH